MPSHMGTTIENQVAPNVVETTFLKFLYFRN